MVYTVKRLINRSLHWQPSQAISTFVAAHLDYQHRWWWLTLRTVTISILISYCSLRHASNRDPLRAMRHEDAINGFGLTLIVFVLCCLSWIWSIPTSVVWSRRWTFTCGTSALSLTAIVSECVNYIVLGNISRCLNIYIYPGQYLDI